ncbi:MAG: hypothetical protein ACO307_16155 [Ilumatobacteraceae bacterium]
MQHPSDGSPPTRMPLAVPGRLAGDATGTAEFLLRSGVDVLVDGYNVTKTVWPRRDLAAQRVVVVTDDAAIVRDVRTAGANHVVVDAFAALFR